MTSENTSSRKTPPGEQLAAKVLKYIDEQGGIEKLAEEMTRGRVKLRHNDGTAVYSRTFVEIRLALALAKREGRSVHPKEILSPGGFGENIFDGGKITSSRKKPTTKRAKGYAEWKPHKKTRRILAQVNAIFNEYHDYLPLTARQVFYRLVGVYGYPKDEKAYERLTNILVRARRAKYIPFEYLRDDGASVMNHAHHYDSEEDFYAATRRRAEKFRLNRLSGQDVSIRVYCEAAGMMPQLHDVLEEFSVPVFSCSGFDSLTAKWDLKEWCHDTLVYEGKTPVVLHLGDYDPSGESIFNDGLVEDIHAFLEEDAPSEFASVEEQFPFQRVALTREQIERRAREGRALPSAPPKAKDSRTRNWRGTATYQLEALPPDELAQILQLAVISWLDRETLEERIEAEPTAKRNIIRALPSPQASQE